jgi:hypothetical protein
MEENHRAMEGDHRTMEGDRRAMAVNGQESPQIEARGRDALADRAESIPNPPMGR